MRWHAADSEAEGEELYLVNWCAGWPQTTREVAKTLDIRVIAVDRELTRMGDHCLNVQLDLLTLSPAFWKAEVASKLQLHTGQLAWDFGGIPCTTQARSDSSNKRMTKEGELQFNNYRITRGPQKGKPQHPEGSEKGDEARNSDRLNLAMLWMCRSGKTKAWGLENPRGQLRKQTYMKPYYHLRVDLDYCKFWDEQERSRGFLWQKPSQIWTQRATGGHWDPVGLEGEAMCLNECRCGYWKASAAKKRKHWKHKGSTEKLTAMVKSLGMNREQLKCTYPRALFRDWLIWATGIQPSTSR
jgi:hypothetical protein